VNDRRDIRMAAHRRNALAQAAWGNIRREAERIAKERGIPHVDAMTAVFADQELLNRCHQVTGPIPDMPKSDIDAQNR